MAIRSYTVPELIARVRLLANEPDEDAFTDSDILEFLNDAQDRFVQLVGRLVSRETLANIVADQQEYPLPTTIQTIHGVWYYDGSDWNRLTYMPYLLQSTHDDDSGSEPSYYYLRRNLIGLIPVPSASSTDSLRVDCSALPDELENDSSAEPFNGDELYKPYAGALAYYAIAQMMARDSKVDLSNWWQQRFDEAVMLARKRLNSRMGDATGAIQFREHGTVEGSIFRISDDTVTFT